MTDERLEDAVSVLLEALEGKEQEVSEIKRTINSLCRTMGREPMFQETEAERRGVVARRDQFYGKPFATAVQEFLRLRKEASSPEEIMTGLLEGGFDYQATGWKKNDRLRMTSLSIAKNTRTFHKLPNGTYGLLEWYPDVQNSSGSAKNTKGSTEDEDGRSAEGTAVEDPGEPAANQPAE